MRTWRLLLSLEWTQHGVDHDYSLSVRCAARSKDCNSNLKKICQILDFWRMWRNLIEMICLDVSFFYFFILRNLVKGNYSSRSKSRNLLGSSYWKLIWINEIYPIAQWQSTNRRRNPTQLDPAIGTFGHLRTGNFTVCFYCILYDFIITPRWSAYLKPFSTIQIRKSFKKWVTVERNADQILYINVKCKLLLEYLMKTKFGNSSYVHNKLVRLVQIIRITY